MLLTQGTQVGRPCKVVTASCNSTNSACVCGSPWDQCGGKSNPVVYKKTVVDADEYTGPMCCTDESACVYKSEYYSQCIPKDVSTADNSQARGGAAFRTLCSNRTGAPLRVPSLPRTASYARQ